jgi:cysteine desulfurase
VKQAVPIIVESYQRLSGSRQSAVGSQHSGSSIKMTQYTSSLGCACKIRPQELERILKEIPLSENPAILVDLRTSDDAAVYRISENMAIVQTVDFIPPIVDDPYSYGAIAAANALSDIYAMGGKPLFALSIIAFPGKLLPVEVLKEIIKGATDKTAEAEISIIGGHSIEDTEPKFGLVVTGSIDPEKILTNSGARPGDVIVLTKPLGTGILSTGMKKGLTDHNSDNKMIAVMCELNKTSCEVMTRFPVSACTDVTGFGLLGHLREMVKGAGVRAEIWSGKVPGLPGVTELIAAGIIPGGTLNNLDYVKDVIEWAADVPDPDKFILADAQTSGGLMIMLPEEFAGQFIRELRSNGVQDVVIIGKIMEGAPSIVVSSGEGQD